MAATALPSTGGPEQTWSCDTSDIYVVHNLFRVSYGDAPALARAVADGDTERAAFLAEYFGELIDALHDHHHTEDDELWDRMEQRDPGCSLHVEKMRIDHREIATLLDELTATLEPWKATADAASRDRVAAALDAVLASLTSHLGVEETDILPIAQRTISQAEWDRMGELARAKVPRERLFIQLGFILASIPEAEREKWKKDFLPVPARVLYALVGRRQYEKYRARVYGTAA